MVLVHLLKKKIKYIKSTKQNQNPTKTKIGNKRTYTPPPTPQVRRAQEAVLSTRPFNEGLQSVFSGLVKRLALENIELPLLQDRAVKSVTVVCMTGDRYMRLPFLLPSLPPSLSPSVLLILTRTQRPSPSF